MITGTVIKICRNVSIQIFKQTIHPHRGLEYNKFQQLVRTQKSSNHQH